MENNFKYSDDNKRYHTLTYYYKKKFNTKVCKVSLNANFTCPNIDGKVVFVDDVLKDLRKAEKLGIKSYHISSFLDYFME